MIGEAFEADYSDDDKKHYIQAIKLQNGTVSFKATGLREEFKESRDVNVCKNPNKAFRLVTPGLMLEGTCDTPTCFAYGKKVLDCQGFVTNLHFAKAMTRAKCRLCGQFLIEVNNLGYFQARLKVEGRRQNQKFDFKKDYIANDGKYHTFKSGEDSMQRWQFLELTAEKLNK